MQILADKQSPLYRELFYRFAQQPQVDGQFSDLAQTVIGSAFVRGGIPSMCAKEYAYLYNPYSDVFALFSVDPNVLDTSKFRLAGVFGGDSVIKASGRQEAYEDGGKFDIPTFDLGARTHDRLSTMSTLCNAENGSVTAALEKAITPDRVNKSFMRYAGALALLGHMTSSEKAVLRSVIIALSTGKVDALAADNSAAAAPVIRSLPSWMLGGYYVVLVAGTESNRIVFMSNGRFPTFPIALTLRQNASDYSETLLDAQLINLLGDFPPGITR
ncbi:MAG: hypothetical protein P4M15_11110 [Alphaproteobacteria bacterium]|nr:hypothetical protein [Alphaproteobacteria bacterium]